MLADEPDLLTTGQAAKLCSVTPDTILKWLKKGRITGVRTAGGHYRINRQELEPFVASSRTECPSRQLAEPDPEELHCWEYLSDRGVVHDECRQCIVYRVRAGRCFLVAGMQPELGHALQFCQGSCEDCAYYRRSKGLATNVLIITDDEALIDELAKETSDVIAMRVARSAYDASAIVQSFHAAVVIVDQQMLAGGDLGLLRSIAADPRLPGAKIILCQPGGARRRGRVAIGHDLVWSVIGKPFELREIAAKIEETDLLARRGLHA